VQDGETRVYRFQQQRRVATNQQLSSTRLRH
jgi:hypothetical protein